MGVNVYMDSYMAPNGSWFMVTWSIFQNRLLKVGLTQNREDDGTLWTLTTMDLVGFIMCEDPHEWKLIEIAFGEGFGHIWLHTTLEGPWPHQMILEVCSDGLWDTFFWALTMSWSRLLAHVWSGPKAIGYRF